jgi:hypothetical protein
MMRGDRRAYSLHRGFLAMTIGSAFVPLTGGCNCGKVRFRMQSAPMITHCCHCRNCQKASGSAFAINAMIETERLTIVAGTPQLFEGPENQKEVQCSDCGFTLWSYLPRFGAAVAFVGVGVLDQGERLPPEAHYFVRSKHPWVILPPDLPAFEELGDPGKPGLRARVQAALASIASSPR